MDWSNVTFEELVDSLKEVEWSTPPRPVGEFFRDFSRPKNYTKWTSRLKCNAYYYRTNYFILIAAVVVLAFVRNPPAVIAVLVMMLSLMLFNDSFALALDEKLIRCVRMVSRPMAAKLRRPSQGPGRQRPSSAGKGIVRICGEDRRLVAGVMLLLSAFLWWLTGALRTVMGSLALGKLLCLLHASFRQPNLKARLNSFKEEFRAAWRSSYTDA